MQIIDTNNIDTMREFEYLKEELEYNQIKKNKYETSDFAMVRTTNHLEKDHILKALSKVPFVVNTNDIPWTVMRNILRDMYNVNLYDENEYEKFQMMVDKYSPLSTQYRSTIHFTLNGLVSNHSKGTFDNQNFIIIDKLDKHLGIDDIRSIRMEDTFVFGEFPVSEEAIILIKEDKLQKLLEKNPYLTTYKNIILYRGDETIATQIVLARMGIVPENIQTHSAEFTERTELHQEYFRIIKEQLGIEQIKHWYSKEYKEDDEKNLKLWQIYNYKFYNELFEYFNMDETRKIETIEYLSSYYNNKESQIELLKKYIIEIGLENYQQFVIDYNRKILNEIENNNYPTNDEIIENNSIILKSDSISGPTF